MNARLAPTTALLSSILSLAGCASIAQLGVQAHTAKTGETIAAGLVEPKTEYACQKAADRKHEWGWKGTSDRTAGILRLTAEAVDTAPSYGANYVHVMPPSEKSVMGFNINTFADAQAAYYRCSSLPTKLVASTAR
jgi:hypothetical protein